MHPTTWRIGARTLTGLTWRHWGTRRARSTGKIRTAQTGPAGANVRVRVSRASICDHYNRVISYRRVRLLYRTAGKLRRETLVIGRHMCDGA